MLDDNRGNDNNIREIQGKNIEIFKTDNWQLENTYKFIHKLDDTLTKMNSLITDDLMEKTINIKRNVEGLHDNTIKKLTDNYTSVREILSEISVFKIEVMDKCKDKILSNILSMQQYYGIAMADIVDGMFIFITNY